MKRLYVVVRSDLSPGLQIAQCLHAHSAFQDDYPEIERTWHAESNTISVLCVPDEHALRTLFDDLTSRMYAASGFYEPDMNDSLTAICVEPGAAKMLKKISIR